MIKTLWFGGAEVVSRKVRYFGVKDSGVWEVRNLCVIFALACVDELARVRGGDAIKRACVRVTSSPART